MVQAENPLDQFLVFPRKLCWTTNFTNALIMVLGSIFLIYFFFGNSVMLYRTILSGIVVKLYLFYKDLYFKNLKYNIKTYFFLFLFLFLLVLVANIFGLIPYSYAITSIFIFNLFLVLSFFSGMNYIGMVYHKWNFFNIFVPKGIVISGLPSLIFFETVSYFARIISLTVRLFANVLSGHILQHILISFSKDMFFFPRWFFILFLIPWAITYVITYLESMISFLQATVICILLLIYFNNAIFLH